MVLDGIEYVKAAEAAKEFRYTSDYVGQLCRSKKIAARLVGRTWYVNLDSLLKHKKNRHSKDRKTATEQGIKTTPPVAPVISKSSVRRVVEPVLKSKTVKRLQVDSKTSPNERILKVTYEPDEEALLPTITKRILPKPKKLRVDPAGAKKVRVSGKRSAHLFKAGELPEVALSGTLKIAEIEAETETPDLSNNKQNKAISEKTENKTKSADEKKTKKVQVQLSRIQLPHTSESGSKTVERPVAFKTPIANKNESLADHELAPDLSTISTFTPNSVREQVAPVSPLVAYAPLVTTLAAILIVIAIFSASSAVTVSPDEIYRSEIVLQVANLLEVLHQ